MRKLWVGLVLVCLLLGCGASALDDAKTAWNVANALGVQALEQIEQGHSQALDACQTDPCIDTVAKRWKPVYAAFRTYREALAMARTVLELPEPASAATLAVATANLVAAQRDLTAELAKVSP